MSEVLPLLAALFLDWSDPAELVRDLADDAIRVRERAASELHRRGGALREFLLETLETAADPEIRARVADVLRRLDAEERIRWFGGGNRVCGFAAVLRGDRFPSWGPVRLTMEIMNVGSKDQELWAVRDWSVETPEQEIRTNGAEARVVVQKFIGHSGFRRTSYRGANGLPKAAVSLRPGESVVFEFELDVKSLPNGDYRIAVEYFAHDLVPGAEEKLRTNTVSLTIRK